MKTLGKYLMLLTAFCALSVTSCVNDDLAERQDLGAGKIATLEDQAAAIEASVADIEALQTALGEGRDAGLEKSASALEDHVADLRAKAPFMDATMTTLALQKKLAEAVGAVLASDSNGDLAKHAATLEKGVKTWLGKHLTAYYPAALAQARTASAIASLDLKTRKLNVEAILSDVEAGLSAYEDVEGLSALAEKVNGNCETAVSLAAELSALTEEVEAEYTKAVETVVSDPENFDAPAIKQFNAGVQTKADEADNTLAGLISRVEDCETQLEEIKTRLETLESKVDNLEELLGMIQSVTFMSEYSEEKAVAYYSLDLNTEAAADKGYPEGAKQRNPEGTISLKYIVRPASAAQALTASDLWDSQVKVFGYYAQAITKAAPETFNFDITNVTADDSGNGIVTVTVSAASLDESFYFKETGAKLALSIATGKTDLTSKFVEIVPKDASGTVYVESIELSAKSIEIDHGAKADLDAFITPDNATKAGVVWATSNPNIVMVTDNGVVEGMSVGNATITATTKGTNEWGNTILAQCNVKVNPAIRLSGPSYVEKGGNITIRIESPDYIDPESVTWTSSAPTLAAITKTDDGNALISGVAMYFNTTDKAYAPITITCDIEGKATLSHEIRVIAVQPKGIAIEGMSADQTTLTLKKGQGYTFNASVQPAEVEMSLFRFIYQSNNAGVVYVPDLTSGKVVANDIGRATVSVKLTDQGQFNYFYPARSEFVRYVEVNVEPYYVTGMSFTESGNAIGADGIELAANSSTQVSISFTSDGGEGVLPTYTDVSWTSSDESVIVVDQNGNIAAKDVDGKEATITVTTANPNAVSGGSPISASFKVSVTKPWHSFEVGDYVLRESDGSIAFASSYSSDISSKIVGVVIAKLNPKSTDTALPADCIHGIAMGLTESSVVQWWNGYPEYGTNYIQSVDKYATQNAYESMLGANYNYLNNPQNYVSNNGDKAYGYNNTLAFKAYLNAAVANGWKVAVYNEKTNANEPGDVVASQLMTALNNISSSKPNNTSDWYLPSVYEMNMISSFVMNDGNTKLTNAGGITLSNDSYWTISESAFSTASNAVLVNPTTGALKANESKKNSHKTRFIFAF